MSILVNKCNTVLKTIPNLLNNGRYVMREFTKLSDFGINWNRPVKVPYISPEISGDLGLDIDIKPTEYCYNYQKSKELSDADERVKKLFMVGFNPQREYNLLRKEKMMDLVRSHNLDEDSVEAKIARFTNKVHLLRERTQQYPKCKRLRRLLKESFEKRNKYLNQLRKSDYKKFEWILEKMNLIYKPYPSNDIQPQRKLSLRKITDQHCEKIIGGKLADYKAHLESQKKDFYREKAEMYVRIRQEELELGLEPTITEEEIEFAKKQAAAYQ